MNAHAGEVMLHVISPHPLACQLINLSLYVSSTWVQSFEESSNVLDSSSWDVVAEFICFVDMSSHAAMAVVIWYCLLNCIPQSHRPKFCRPLSRRSLQMLMFFSLD